MRLFLRIFFLTLFIQSCFTPEKAKKQQDKILRKHPEVAAEKIRTAFPCVTTSVDSLEYLKSMKSLDSLLKDTASKLVTATADRIKKVKDSLRLAIIGEKDSTMRCEEERDGLLDYASKLQVKNEGLERELQRNISVIKTLAEQVRNIKPIVKTIEDSAKIYVAMLAQTKAEKEALEWKLKYEIDHKWRVEKEAKEKGKLIIMIPWMWIIVLMSIIGLLVFLRLKFGLLKGFNPFSKK